MTSYVPHVPLSHTFKVFTKLKYSPDTEDITHVININSTPSLYPTHTHTHTQTHSHTHTTHTRYTHTHSQELMHSHTCYTHTHAQPHSQEHMHTHTHAIHTHPHIHSQEHMHSHMLYTHTDIYTYKNTCTHTHTHTNKHTHTHRVLTREQRQYGADFLYEASFLVLISLRACSAAQKPVARLSVLLPLHQTLAQAPVRLASTRHQSIHFYFSTAGKYTSPINTLLLQHSWQVHVTNQYTSTSV